MPEIEHEVGKPEKLLHFFKMKRIFSVSKNKFQEECSKVEFLKAASCGETEFNLKVY